MNISDVVNGVLEKGKEYARPLFSTALVVTPLLATTPKILHSYTLEPPVATSYSRNPVQSYDLQRDGMYVHIPSFVKIHRAPLSVFGPHLYGLAIPSTGDIFIREDLEGDAFSEVLDHEAGHVLDPTRSENTNRSIMRAKWGERGVVHQKLGWANY